MMCTVHCRRAFFYAALAQPAEHPAHNRVVAGSIPARGMIYSRSSIGRALVSKTRGCRLSPCRERSAIKLTINESLAKQLGLYEIAELEKEAASENLNQTFRILGGEYISKPYITLSKNKNEIKFEANDKEILSSIFSILIPMWKQHVFYLNQEENNLLAELRDAMIPDLMSGKISLE